mmetsp:Transcript_97089/g.271761  ORF Transcript_97089/g.271761 Transcript_97089/m.271761 type:complete len:236 (-) Transcript_97089:98-805(-)
MRHGRRRRQQRRQRGGGRGGCGPAAREPVQLRAAVHVLRSACAGNRVPAGVSVRHRRQAAPGPALHHPDVQLRLDAVAKVDVVVRLRGLHHGRRSADVSAGPPLGGRAAIHVLGALLLRRRLPRVLTRGLLGRPHSHDRGAAAARADRVLARRRRALARARPRRGDRHDRQPPRGGGNGRPHRLQLGAASGDAARQPGARLLCSGLRGSPCRGCPRLHAGVRVRPTARRCAQSQD